MSVLRYSLAVIVALIIGMPFAAPCDESDSQPSTCTPSVSIALLIHVAPVTTFTLGARCCCRQVPRDFDYYTHSLFRISHSLHFINRSLRC
jgi:hypothetical protein